MKNVVLLTIDTLCRDVLGCYGDKDNLSPFIDSVAEKGLLFTNNYTIAPYTQASFPGILTSSYLYDYAKSDKLSAGRIIISEALKKNNIYSAGFHSNPYLCGYFGWNRGWNHFYDSMEDDVTDISPYIKGGIINQKVDTWLQGYKDTNKDKPFFLWTHYMDVHEPYVPENKYIDQVDPSITLSNDEMFKLFKDVILPRDTSNKETVDLLRKLYKAHVKEIDDYTKEFFSILDKHGVLDQSTIIITTDHGDEFLEHNSLSHDGKMYDELVHCPLIISNQGQGCSDKLTSGLDISPTVMSLFGLEPEANFQGQSILPLDDYPEKGCFGEAVGKLSHKIKPTDKPAYYYKEKNLKVIYRVEDNKWELYDLANDPLEEKNIIDSSDKSEEMKAKLSPRINRATK